MSEETTGAKGLPILKNEQFGLNEKDIKRILKETEEELRATQESLSVNKEARERQYLESHLKSVQAQLSVLSQPPKRVLATARYFYDRTAELGKQGLNEDTMLEQLANEFTEINAYYGLLRMKPWGYRLGQSIMATRAGQSRRK